VALITTDGYRIGAFDQLHTFGMILDMPVRMASNHEALQSAIADFADRSLILIDTAGMSQRDVRLSQQFSLIGATPQVKRYLVLAANADTHALEEAVSAFNQVPLAGCIITKLDEANRLGGALSVIHDRGLSLAYVSDGQRVPEDLQSAQIEPLLRMGEALMAASSRVNEDETLALAFGKGVINACF
jgi:flagellar biosynthesis protein FlhF